MVSRILSLTAGLLISIFAFSQTPTVEWEINQSRLDDGSYVLSIKANIDPSYYIYGMKNTEGPLPLIMEFDQSDKNVVSAKFSEVSKSEKIYDEVFGVDVYTFSGQAEFNSVFVPKSDIMALKLIVDGQACNKKDGSCIQVYHEIEIPISK